MPAHGKHRSPDQKSREKKADARFRRLPLMAPDGSGLAKTYVTGVILGPSGSGKTTFAEQLAHQYVRMGGRAWAIDPNGAWKDSQDVKSLWAGYDQVEALMESSAHWKPGLIIGDDADLYVGPHPTMPVKRYITSNRHIQKDQLWISRRPQGIPKDLFGVMHFVALFPGALMEPGAHRYLEETWPDEILDAVPLDPYNYLLIQRDGARWRYERRKTVARTLVTKSDKQ